MKVWNWKLYEFRCYLTDLAHRNPNKTTISHDILEFIAYRIIDPFIWL